MQFVYGEFAKENRVKISIKEYSHIFKVRRIDKNKPLFFRNLKDDFIYTYKIEEIDKKKATLVLIDKEKSNNSTKSALHVGWCIIDTKVVEKHLAMLNEMGVKKLTFVYSEFSQKNFKLDLQRLKRILINSCEQCGRTDLMEIELLNDVKEYLNLYPNSIIIDFSNNLLENSLHVESFLVGPEGGFSKKERELFEKNKIFGLKSQNILKSQTAVLGVCAKILL
jgi:16S rRNA (uracil1498-N3)-methyltransferase